jgi:serine/threonine protein kinase
VGFPQLIPHASADAIDLLVKLLKYDAAERITAREAMRSEKINKWINKWYRWCEK